MYKVDEELVYALKYRCSYLIAQDLVKLLMDAANRIEVLSNASQLEATKLKPRKETE